MKDDMAGQEGMVSPGHRYVWQREWPKSTWIPRQPAPGTWLGGVVHDPDEPFGQEVVVGGLLGCTGHWELNSLQFCRVHTWDGESDKL